MFVDFTKIYIKAGQGGNGQMSFRREKYIAAGGPDGGDGGRGGNIVFIADTGMNTLMDFRYKKKYFAEPGGKGGTNRKHGKDGKDLLIKVPLGTVIKDEKNGRVLADISHENDKVIVAKGGRGGRGNVHFASSTRQVPNFAEDGEDGEERDIVLELKLLADVGLVGFPNAGKSTILSMMTLAKPKIANYPFTTLVPNLGIVRLDNGESFVLADIPGLIEGAHQGVGLGHSFLRHIERTRIIVHVVDISGQDGRDPVLDFKIINNELKEYSDKLANKKQIVAINKMDIVNEEHLKNIKKEISKNGYDYFEISAVTGKGVQDLFKEVAKQIKEIQVDEIEVDEEPEIEITIDDINKKEWNVRKDGEVFVIEGKAIDRLIKRVNFNEWESLQYFQKVLQNLGVNQMLEDMGIQEGDIVRVCDMEFEHI